MDLRGDGHLSAVDGVSCTKLLLFDAVVGMEHSLNGGRE